MLASAHLPTIILTSRLPEAELFYRDLLGLPLLGRSHGALVFDVGGSQLRVSAATSTQPSLHTVAGFRDPDGNLLSVVQYVREYDASPGLPG